MMRPVREPQGQSRRGGDDLMLNHLPPFSPLRGLSDTPIGPQFDPLWRHGSGRTWPISTLDAGQWGRLNTRRHSKDTGGGEDNINFL